MSPSPVSSTPILRRTLIWSAVATVALAIVAGGVGFLVAQGEGLVSGLLGVLLSALFLAITGISILVANRWYGDPIYVQLFFAIVLGGWLLKLGLFVVVMILLGVLLSALFLAITGISILVANRWYGDPIYVQLFFAIVLGGWLLKLGLFVVVMILLGGQPWLQPMVFFLSIVAGVIMSLIVDVLVITRMRLPNVSDTTLPTEVPEDVAPGSQNRPDAGSSEGGQRS